MQERDLFFVIPTYRLRDVGETVEHYDEHFWRHGHSVRMIVFDDSRGRDIPSGSVPCNEAGKSVPSRVSRLRSFLVRLFP
jgi:hypothetical protein